MDNIEDMIYPQITLATDDIVMDILVKKDYSKIDDVNERKKEFIRDLKDFIEEFEATDESLEFVKYFD